MKILVTGANGYVGRHVVDSLLSLGQEVIAFDVKTDRVCKKAKCVSGSFFDKKEDWFSFFGKPDVCIHLAWRDGFNHNSPNHILDLSSHYSFLLNLINHGLKNLAIMGTRHEIGYFNGEIDSDTPCNPMSLYGIAKNALRQAVLLEGDKNGVNVFWRRGFYIVGDDLNNHSVFTKILQMSKEGQKTFPFTSGKNKYDFISIDDLARDISLTAIQNKVTGIINLCSGLPVSLGQKVEEFIEQNGLQIKPDYGAFPDRPYDSPAIWGNPDKINQIIKNYNEEHHLY